MKSQIRHQRIELDRTIVALLNERARMVAEDPAGADDEGARVDDLLRRSTGPFPASALRSVFRSIEEGCRNRTQGAER